MIFIKTRQAYLKLITNILKVWFYSLFFKNSVFLKFQKRFSVSYFYTVNYGVKLLILNVISSGLITGMVYNLLHDFHIISFIWYTNYNYIVNPGVYVAILL